MKLSDRDKEFLFVIAIAFFIPLCIWIALIIDALKKDL